MTIVHQPRHGKQAPVKTAPPASPERLGPGHYKVWSRTQPGVAYETRIDPATGERISCTCLAGQNDRHCWHGDAAREAEAAMGVSEATDAPGTPHAPAQAEKDGTARRDASPITHGRCRDCGALGALLDGLCLFGACYPAAAHTARRRR